MAEQFSVRERRWRRPHSIFWPIFLIALGVIFLMDTMNVLPGTAWELVARYWPLLFIASALDNLYRGENFVGPVVTIGFGVLILLANLGYFPADGWTLVLRFWPVLVIAWGLDLVIGRQSTTSAVMGIVAGLLLTGLIAWLALSNFVVTPARTQNISQPLQDAEEVDVRLEMVAANTNFTGGPEKGQLLAGQAEVTGQDRLDSTYSVSNGRGVYHLKQQGVSYVAPFGSPAQHTWDLKLTDQVPVNLDSSMVMGSQTIDLSQLDLKSLKMETVMGRSTIILPQDFEDGEATVVMGELVIIVPRDADTVIDVDTAMTAVSMPDGFHRSNDRIYSPSANEGTSPVDLKVSIPVGSLVIKYP